MRELLLLCLVLFDGVHLARSAQTAFNPNSLAVETRRMSNEEPSVCANRMLKSFL